MTEKLGFLAEELAPGATSASMKLTVFDDVLTIFMTVGVELPTAVLATW